MKKLLMFLSLILLVVMGCTAQELIPEEPSTFTLQGFEEYFASLAALAGLVVIISGYVIKLLFKEIPTKIVKQLISWGVSLILCLIGWLLKLGIFVGTEWWSIIAYGMAAGLVSNGIFDIKFVQVILSWLKIKNKKQG
jgi:hypothetical protein